jgi:hypothetical protein
MPAAVATVVGLRALMKDVDKLCKDERSALFAAMKKAGYDAVKPVAVATKAALPVSERQHVQARGALKGSVRASAYRSGAAVRMGSKRVPWAGWMEFGGTRKRPHPSTREYRSSGYYLFPAARDLAPTAVREYVDAINEIFGRTAIWTNTTTNGEQVHD